MAKKKKRNYWYEVTGIVLAGFSVFLACCLISYNPADPSFETGLAIPPPEIHNWGKQIGSYISSFLFQVLGLGAYVLPVSIFLISIKLLFSPRFPYAFYIRCAAYIVLFVCGETFLSLCFGKLNLPTYKFDAGGALLGGVLSEMLRESVGNFGAYLLILIIFLVVIMGLTKISYVRLGNLFYSAVQDRVQVPVRRIFSQVQSAGSKLLGGVKITLLQRLFVKKKKAALISKKSPVKDDPELKNEYAPDDIPINIYREKDSAGSMAGEGPDFKPINKDISIEYTLPSLSLLDPSDESSIDIDREALMGDADILIQKLADFGVTGRVVEINPGPVVTRFEFEPAPGVKLNRIVGLSDDLALALKAMSVRIAAIPGKSVVGIEIPNKKRKKVPFREIVSRDEFVNSRSNLTIGLGKDIAGGTIINDLSRMPHLLVAGTTGSGKSVFVNTVICSILFKATPDEVRFLLIDPKRLELFPYDGIPHLLYPVVMDPKKAASALRWVVEEMDRRYIMLAEKGTRDIVQYNKIIDKELAAGKDLPDAPRKMNCIVVVIDELADLMMVAARDVEGYIARLAQMARASGIHLLVATQRPSVDILTGVIKANFPSRISFQVSSKVDSRTILDIMGAEKLLGMGDMLFMPPGTSRLQRIHGAFISEKEIYRIAEFIKAQGQPSYDESIVAIEQEDKTAEEEEEYDELYDRAVALVTDTHQASISMLQRKMKVGYNRAARMIELMEKEGVVGPSDGVKPRAVLANKL